MRYGPFALLMTKVLEALAQMYKAGLAFRQFSWQHIYVDTVDIASSAVLLATQDVVRCQDRGRAAGAGGASVADSNSSTATAVVAVKAPELVELTAAALQELVHVAAQLLLHKRLDAEMALFRQQVPGEDWWTFGTERIWDGLALPYTTRHLLSCLAWALWPPSSYLKCPALLDEQAISHLICEAWKVKELAGPSMWHKVRLVTGEELQQGSPRPVLWYFFGYAKYGPAVAEEIFAHAEDMTSKKKQRTGFSGGFISSSSRSSTISGKPAVMAGQDAWSYLERYAMDAPSIHAELRHACTHISENARMQTKHLIWCVDATVPTLTICLVNGLNRHIASLSSADVAPSCTLNERFYMWTPPGTATDSALGHSRA